MVVADRSNWKTLAHRVKTLQHRMETAFVEQHKHAWRARSRL